MRTTAAILAVFAATPAFAASGPFLSLANTNFVVLISFILFLGVLFYFKVPSLLMGLLDKRAEGIRAELSEARALREEAQTVLASFERKQKEVQEQADRIVAQAKTEAEQAAEQAKVDLEKSIARRMQAADDQISSAVKAAERDVREKAAAVAVSVAGEVVAAKMSAKDGNGLIDAAILDVGAKLH